MTSNYRYCAARSLAKDAETTQEGPELPDQEVRGEGLRDGVCRMGYALCHVLVFYLL